MNPVADLSHRNSRTLLYVPGSFSETSGGRTRATFLRAGLLARDAAQSWILTFNFRIDYDQIFSSWASRTALPGNVGLLNFYEGMAGERLYWNDRSRRFRKPEGARKVGPRRWMVRDEAGVERTFYLRDDRSLKRSDVIAADGQRSVEFFDLSGQLRVRERRASGVIERDYFASKGRRFASVRERSAGRRVVRVEGGELDTGGSFQSELEVQMRWMAVVVGRISEPVVMIEHRMYDRLFLDNPGLDRVPPTVAVIHSTHLLPPFTDLHAIRAYNGKALARMDDFDAVVVLTEEQASDIRAHFDVSRMYVIPHPVSSSRGPVIARRSTKRVVVATRLIEMKRVDHMIRAFAQVLKSHPDAEFHIWGVGDQLQELERLASLLGAEASVRFWGHSSNVSDVLREGTVGLSASENEGIGLSVVEALSEGLPVVSYAYKYGPVDMIRNGVDGFVVPDGDVEAMASRISWILSHPMRRRLMGFRARAVRRKFRPARVRREWLQLLQSVESGR